MVFSLLFGINQGNLEQFPDQSTEPYPPKKRAALGTLGSCSQPTFPYTTLAEILSKDSKTMCCCIQEGDDKRQFTIGIINVFQVKS